ncbi:cysteine desulfurase family protein [Neoroseomonas oryzicola]|uniref:Cysteine desulfurase n=1 Tax=Neoroseomonas oryzicola TaxID=535904 RepID=A0A9X9WJ95_9PROT|nr:aminotransferase class V-fold PLP-dependent enzyme [Neoroseomonas oryzicola]MBR0660405.1 aminotransferase class V-fold PLP-dependent enzyme [Neoroseomonas oryzicola]NKE17355.1 aminotransferase class V-fold PLP-dependent enzyme [Neoroseomonas oryzicola]
MTAGPNRPIYLDCHATTPVDPRVLAAMRPWWEENFANPGSVEHALGRAAEEAVEEARGYVAELIGADAKEIILTSGATESNNLAIKGAARFAAAQGSDRRRIVTVATEHKCVLESVKALAGEGFEPVILPVDANGLLDLDALRAAVDETTLLVSVMAVNNEIGVIQDLAAIGEVAKAAGALFHTDAAQAAGRIPLDVEEIRADLMSLSGHKIYGPKGIGALYVRRRPRVRLAALFSGGGQERGLRSGTLPAPLVVGLGEAARIAAIEGMLDSGRIAGQRDRFLEALTAAVPGVALNAPEAPKVTGNVNIAFPGGVSAQDIMAAAPMVCVSTGSACSSAEVEPSYVLKAIGLDESRARATLRIGIGRFTSPADVDQASALLAEAWSRAVSGTSRAAE